MKHFLLLAGVSGLVLAASNLRAQTALASWNFDNPPTYLTASSFDPILASAPVISYGSGVTVEGATVAGNCSNTLTASSSGYGTAFDANDYLEVTVTPAMGQYIFISSLVFNVRTNGTGPVSYSVRSGEDGFATDLYTGTNEISQSECMNETATIGLGTTDAITFRIYFYGAGNGAGMLHLDALSVVTDVILPVRVLNFSAAKNGTANRIVWEVADEVNLMSYTVERSADGKNYQALGKVMAAGSTNYSFTDAKPGAVNYYRLAMAERNGSTTRGKVVSVVNENSGVAMQMLPNLVSSNAIVALSLGRSGTVTLSITDMSGRVVLRSKTSMQQTSASIPLNLSNLKAGTYQLMAETETGSRQTLRFVKQ